MMIKWLYLEIYERGRQTMNELLNDDIIIINRTYFKGSGVVYEMI